MGSNMVLRLLEQGVEVLAYNRSDHELKNVDSVEELVSKLDGPRVVWLMLPAGRVTQDYIDKLGGLLDKGDVVIDGSNNYFKDAKKHFGQLSGKGIIFLDVGVSGGPEGARKGACLMIGGEERDFNQLKWLFEKISAPEAFQFFPGIGAGHFVKMVHNGIEYGMMQAIAEGFNLMKQSEFDLNLFDVARIYNKRSVIESRLVEWLYDSFKKYGVELNDFGGTVGHLGEGQWVVEYAEKKDVPLKVISDAFRFRIDSVENPSYIGQILQALRTAFGGKRSELDRPVE